MLAKFLFDVNISHPSFHRYSLCLFSNNQDAFLRSLQENSKGFPDDSFTFHTYLGLFTPNERENEFGNPHGNLWVFLIVGSALSRVHFRHLAFKIFDKIGGYLVFLRRP